MTSRSSDETNCSGAELARPAAKNHRR